jgi:UDP:flavonoid glycosyltransferase YjiC (YdhE family)
VFALGSRGDVQPCVTLGAGLKAAGHDVVIASFEAFRPLARGVGLDFAPVASDPGHRVELRRVQAWHEAGRNPGAFIRRMVSTLDSQLLAAIADFKPVAEGADAVISPLLGFSGFDLADKLGIPSFGAFLQPVTPTRAFAHPYAVPPSPSIPGPLVPRYNRASYVFAEALWWRGLRRLINRGRTEVLGLGPMPREDFYRWTRHPRHPILYGYSPSVLPRPSDWGDWAHVTGYWFPERPAEWRPPAGLEEFLDAGPAPVYVGFGSMMPREPAVLEQTILTALERTGLRAVLLRGPARLGGRGVPENVFVVDDIPHDWLLPRVRAIVHHGGSGTTGAGFHAGVPAVAVPFFFDQAFWGWRLAALGVGPPSIPYSRLTAERLAAALDVMTRDVGMRERAATLGARVRAENGVADAVAAFHRHVGHRPPAYAR